MDLKEKLRKKRQMLDQRLNSVLRKLQFNYLCNLIRKKFKQYISILISYFENKYAMNFEISLTTGFL